MVTIKWSILEDTLSSETPFVAMNSVAPRERASDFLESVLLNTVTCVPILAANWMARWPKPPTPMMPTRSVGRALND